MLTRPRVGDVDYRGTDVLRGDHPFRQVREEGQVLSIRWFSSIRVDRSSLSSSSSAGHHGHLVHRHQDPTGRPTDGGIR